MSKKSTKGANNKPQHKGGGGSAHHVLAETPTPASRLQPLPPPPLVLVDPPPRQPFGGLLVYLALAPKSDSIKRAHGALMDDVEGTRADPVPLHLRNAVTGLMRGLGYGKDYRYAHDRPEHFAPEETFLPDSLAGRGYYGPTERGAEKALKTRLEEVRRSVRAAGRARTGDTSGSRPASD